MDRTLARRLLFVALAIGIAADLLLDGPAFGINVPIMVAAVLAGGWFVRRRGRAPDPLDAWLPIAALVLAAFVAVRGDPFVALLDTAGAAAFTGASLVAFSGLAVTRRSASVVLAMGAWLMAVGMAGTPRLIRQARSPRGDAPRRRPDWLAPLGRGLFLAVPLVLIFAVLFASADPIFRRGMDDLLGWRIDLGNLPGRVLFILAVTWFMGGLLSVAATGIPDLERASLGAAARTDRLPLERVLGAAEAIVVLVAVDLVVALFVGLQVAYLFGGLDTLAAAGLTYSDYARRGYFELVAAAGLAGGVLVGLELAVRTRPRVYVAAAMALVGLTVLVLASAALRLQLYQDAYGWTELRLYVAVSIVAMALSLAVLAIFLASDRTGWLGHAMAVIGLASLVGLNLLAPAAFVAQRNVERVLDPRLVPADGFAGLDTDYLQVLPDDAIPALVEALPRLPAESLVRVRVILLDRRRELAGDPAFASPFSWNAGRNAAETALSTLP
ncbi:MAG: DUF4173 domain-containing protein [Candidatus Limnocylindrales bacterium]